MVIDIKTYKQKGESQGNFNFVFRPDNNLLNIPNAEFACDATIKGNFYIEGKDVFVDGSLTLTIKAECARCLEETTCQVELSFEEKFSIFKDEDCYLYQKDRVDLTEMVKDLILSDAPLCIYCKPDCKGLCPICGTNLNKSNCECGNL